MKRYRFRSRQRMQHAKEFRRVYDRRCSASDAALIVYACENGLEFSRLGVSVGKRLGGAVERNRLKRLLREAFRLTQGELPVGLDYVLIPREAARASLEAFTAALPHLAQAAARKLLRGAKR